MPTKRASIDFEYYDPAEGKQAMWFQINGKEVWIPRSVVYEVDEEDRVVTVAEWWVIRNELV